MHSLLRQVVVDTGSTKTVLVGVTDLCRGFPATCTIRLVEAISADAGAGRKLEIGSVETVIAHLIKVVRLIKIYGYLWIQFYDLFLIPRNIFAEDAANPSHIIPVVYDVTSHVIVVYLNFVGHRVDLSVKREIPVALEFYLRADEVVYVARVVLDDRCSIYIEVCGRFMQFLDVVVIFVVGVFHIGIHDLVGVYDLYRRHVVHARGAQHKAVAKDPFTHNFLMLPTQATEQFSETSATYTHTGRQDEIARVKAVFAHLIKV